MKKHIGVVLIIIFVLLGAAIPVTILGYWAYLKLEFIQASPERVEAVQAAALGLGFFLASIAVLVGLITAAKELLERRS